MSKKFNNLRKSMSSESQKRAKGKARDMLNKIDPDPSCGCHKCNPHAWWMVLCDECSHKRCPHATDHDLECTDSNDPGQTGSLYK